MAAIPVIAIIDVGKTNKKLFLFEQNYNIIFERSARFTETVDEDGFPCEDLESLRSFVFDSLTEVFRNKKYNVKAINFCAYGASFVHIDENGKPVTPLYNYLKPFPEQFRKQFYDTYGGEETFSYLTASPVLGHLNSGMQLYYLKHAKPELYGKIKYSLHLPQYMSYLISGKVCSDLTSIGCHTNLWDFQKNNYHDWVTQEAIKDKLAPIAPCDEVVPAIFSGNSYVVGVGLHDSSAALIPYLINFHDPFVLISTGTWCITLNPFNAQPLTAAELKMDCLSYLSYTGTPVKASRIFAGNEHEQQVKRLAEHFNESPVKYRSIEFVPGIVNNLQKRNPVVNDIAGEGLKQSLFTQRNLAGFTTYEEAYHQLMMDIVNQQYASSQLVIKDTEVKRIFVDGGFSKNPLYMNLLAIAFPEMEVYAASMAQGTAVGAALAIHKAWNKKPLPNNIIELKYYSVSHDALA